MTQTQQIATASSAPDLSMYSTKTVGQRVAANTGLMMGSKILGVFFGAGSLIVAAKSLDAALLGIVLFLHTYMLLFAEVATFSSWQSIIRFGTDSVKDNNHKGLAKILNFGVKLDLMAALFGFLLAISIFFLFSYILNLSPNLNSSLSANLETSRPYIIGYCLLIIMSQRGTSVGIFRLFDKFYVLAIKSLIMPAVRFFGVLVAVYLDAGLKGFVLAWFAGSFCAYAYIPIMAILELKRRNLLSHVIKAKTSFLKPGKGVWNFVIKTNLDSTLNAASVHLPTVLVFGVFGAAWVAVYKIAEEIAKLLSEGYVLLDQVIYPELAKMVSQGQADKIWRLVTRAAFLLLSMGLSISAVVMLFGPDLLSRFVSQDYSSSAPLMSLLVPAAALLGIAAPLYPVFYAANKPERAIYARGMGVIVYVLSFFIFAATIGKMAPGWAAIFGNATAVILVVIMAKRTLTQEIKRKQDTSEAVALDVDDASAPPILNLIGESQTKLWGLPLREWQGRAFKKAGVLQHGGSNAVSTDALDKNIVHIGVQWVLSSALAKAFVARPNIALIEAGEIVGVNGVDGTTARGLIGQSAAALEGTDLTAVKADDLDDGYNKALRKTEAPYAINIHETSVAALQKRQFASSYKGITDFVTKWFWPVPAFYVTRACAALRLTPNMVTTVGLVLTFMAMYYFWQGQWALGFATGWMMTFLDTVDGKLARTTMTYSWWGNIYDHGIDLIHPPFWYFAWYVGLGSTFSFSNVFTDPMTFAIAAICFGYVFDRIVEGIFMRLDGFHIHVWTKFNSALRFFIARRNPNTFIFMIGIILTAIWAQAGHIAFYIVAIWTWTCIAINIVSLIVALFVRRKGPLQSWMDR